MSTKKAKSSKKPAVKPATGLGTIKAFVTPLILAGKLSPDEIVKAVKGKFSKSAFNAKHVSWYRGHLAADGRKVPAAPKKAAPAPAAPAVKDNPTQAAL